VLVYAPPIGTGMKVKILEAMAFGVPVVTNEEGFEGLEADSNPGVRLARTDEEIVEPVVDLLADAVARQRLIEDGLACLARTFSPRLRRSNWSDNAQGRCRCIALTRTRFATPGHSD